MPLQIGFDEVQMIFRIIRRQFDGLFQPVTRLVPAADADRPARRVAIQQAEAPFRPGIIKVPVQFRPPF